MLKICISENSIINKYLPMKGIRLNIKAVTKIGIYIRKRVENNDGMRKISSFLAKSVKKI